MRATYNMGMKKVFCWLPLVEYAPATLPLALGRRNPTSPTTNPLRQPVFRTWHSHVDESVLAPIFLDSLQPVVVELLPCLLDFFSNPSQIGYETGHDTNFTAFLFCLASLSLIIEEDYWAVVFKMFVAYVNLMRKLHVRYQLETDSPIYCFGINFSACFLFEK